MCGRGETPRDARRDVSRETFRASAMDKSGVGPCVRWASCLWFGPAEAAMRWSWCLGCNVFSDVKGDHHMGRELCRPDATQVKPRADASVWVEEEGDDAG